MRVCWLLDADMFDGYRDELVTAIRAHGHECKLIHAPSAPYRWEDVGCSYRETFPRESCVVALGDIDLVTRIHREKRWTPGAFCTVENFFCSSYACRYGEYLLNQPYVMLPFGELERCQDFLFRTVGKDDQIFVRPDSPLKLFTGQVASRTTFARDVEFMGFYEFPPSSLVLVGAPQEITNEWRFVVAKGKVIAGSQYKREGKLEPSSQYDQRAWDLAQTIANLDYAPDPVWVLDICKTAEGEYRLLEIGGFSFADLYATDKAAVVRAVGDVAGEIWQRQET